MDHVVAGGADNDSIFEGGNDDLLDMQGGDDAYGGNMYGGGGDQEMYGGNGDQDRRDADADADAMYGGGPETETDEERLITRFFGDQSPLVGALNKISDALNACLLKLKEA